VRPGLGPSHKSVASKLGLNPMQLCVPLLGYTQYYSAVTRRSDRHKRELSRGRTCKTRQSPGRFVCTFRSYLVRTPGWWSGRFTLSGVEGPVVPKPLPTAIWPGLSRKRCLAMSPRCKQTPGNRALGVDNFPENGRSWEISFRVLLQIENGKYKIHV